MGGRVCDGGVGGLVGVSQPGVVFRAAAWFGCQKNSRAVCGGVELDAFAPAVDVVGGLDAVAVVSGL